MKGYGFKAILAMVGGALAAVLLVSQVSAVTPSLSLVNNGYGTIQVTVYGDANAPVILDYYANGILNTAAPSQQLSTLLTTTFQLAHKCSLL
jgi:hypothetical protein